MKRFLILLSLTTVALAGPSSSKTMLDSAISPQQSEDPMLDISKKMTSVVDDLTKEQTGKPVQTKQKEIVKSLDLLIKEMEKACSSGSGAGTNPNKPMGQSTLAGGPGGINELYAPKTGEKKWGELKPKEREQILQSKNDGFPQGYEALLQSYYRRLASERPVEETTEAPSEKK